MERITAVREFGAKLAEWQLNLGEVEYDLEMNYFPLLEIPAECCEEMLECGITSPDPNEFWQGYNEYIHANLST